MAQLRQQGAGAVVGQAQGHAGPACPGAAQGVVRGVAAHHHRTLIAGEALQFGERHRVHAAPSLRRTLAQGDDEQAARVQQAEQLAQGTGTLGGGDVLPHGTEQDHTEGEPEAQRGGQGRQLVGDPAHARAGVAPDSLGAQGRGGLDRDHVVPEAHEPGGIAAPTSSTRSHVAGSGPSSQPCRRSGATAS